MLVFEKLEQFQLFETEKSELTELFRARDASCPKGKKVGVKRIRTIVILWREMDNYKMNADDELLKNLDKLHTTELGVERIKRNLFLDTDDVVGWCKAKIDSVKAVITRSGKNWYVNIDNCIITVNAYSYTIITAHREKKWNIQFVN